MRQSIRTNVHTVKAYLAALLTQTHIYSGDTEAAFHTSSEETMHEGFVRAYYLLGCLSHQESLSQEAIHSFSWSFALLHKLGLEESITVAYCHERLEELQTAIPL